MHNPNHLEVVSARGRKHGRATLADVAQKAGVTIMTVSRYLSQRAKVAEHTAQKIKQAIADAGYTPNLQALSLASGRSQVVAVMVPNITHSIFADTLHGLGAGLHAARLQMLVSASGYSLSLQEEQLRTVLGWAPAGIVVTGRAHSPGTEQLLKAALARGTPVVQMWDRSTRAAEFVQIGFNHHRAGQQMAQALLEAREQRDIVYVDSAVEQDLRAQERARGFLAHCKKRHAPATLLKAPAHESDPVKAGQLAVQAWLKLHPEKKACFAFANDMLGCGALFALQQAGCHVPQDFRLLGFGDFSLGRYVSTQGASGLSTLRIDGERIGQLCAAYLSQPGDHGHLDFHTPPELLWRGT